MRENHDLSVLPAKEFERMNNWRKMFVHSIHSLRWAKNCGEHSFSSYSIIHSRLWNFSKTTPVSIALLLHA